MYTSLQLLTQQHFNSLNKRQHFHKLKTKPPPLNIKCLLPWTNWQIQCKGPFLLSTLPSRSHCTKHISQGSCLLLLYQYWKAVSFALHQLNVPTCRGLFL